MYFIFWYERNGSTVFFAVSEQMMDEGYARNDTQVKKLKFTHIIKKKILCLYNPDTFSAP
jgi:hypothetical protein